MTSSMNASRNPLSPSAAATSQPAPRASERDTSRDGFRNKLEDALLTGGRPLWAVVNGQPWLSRILNRVIVDNAVRKAPVRPLRLSTMDDYPSWSSLTDKTWFSRYLPPRDLPTLPSLEDISKLYVTRLKGQKPSRHSTLLFPIFAQWFTDGFLMTRSSDPRQTTTNHQIDLSQLYGLNTTVRDALRLKSEALGSRGRLLAETRNGEEWAPLLFGANGLRDPRFAALPEPMRMPSSLAASRKATMFAFGGERANSTLFTAALNTLFLREHNRLCKLIEGANPAWNDHRVFETARAVNVVQLIKIVVEEYVNHISPYWFKFLADPTVCYRATWNRENWIPVEFNLLYRWHSLVPETARWDGRDLPMTDARFCNGPLLRDGVAVALASASDTTAWQIGLFNTPAMLRDVELASLMQGRFNRLASYNDYREVMQYPRLTRFEQISGDPDVVAALKGLYPSGVDDVEFFVGLFAEDVPERSALPPLIGRLVAADAFSHALTNPLLSPHVYDEQTFTRVGMTSIAATASLQDIVARNSPGPIKGRISMNLTEQPSFA